MNPNNMGGPGRITPGMTPQQPVNNASQQNQGGILGKAISGLGNMLSAAGTSPRNKMGPGGVGPM